jgi:hypothetical protein
VISAENAALKSDSFFIPNNKARLSLLDQHVKNGLSFCSLGMQSLIEKPKANHTKSHLLCKATTATEERRELNITTPPSPSKSRSTTLLNDFKKGFLRKKNEDSKLKTIN